MHVWSQCVSFVLSIVSFGLATRPRYYTSEHAEGTPFWLYPMHKLMRFPIFWLGPVFLAYILIQALNPAWNTSPIRAVLVVAGHPLPRLAAYGHPHAFRRGKSLALNDDLLVRLDDGLRALDRFNPPPPQYGLSCSRWPSTAPSWPWLVSPSARWEPRRSWGFIDHRVTILQPRLSTATMGRVSQSDAGGIGRRWHSGIIRGKSAERALESCPGFSDSSRCSSR